ncbi:MAG: hypothetical protein SFV18_22090 [Bryobacteraceae bacterium]|nr:hypothetical protein [Bryobacteraceae bacterium]
MATTKKSAKKALKPVDSLSAAQAKRMLGKMNTALKEAGFAGRVQELHLLPLGAPPPGPMAAAVSPCPPPKRIRRVCVRQNDGSVRCEDRCV